PARRAIGVGPRAGEAGQPAAGGGGRPARAGGVSPGAYRRRTEPSLEQGGRTFQRAGKAARAPCRAGLQAGAALFGRGEETEREGLYPGSPPRRWHNRMAERAAAAGQGEVTSWQSLSIPPASVATAFGPSSCWAAREC